jgi:hypothetical protein
MSQKIVALRKTKITSNHDFWCTGQIRIKNLLNYRRRQLMLDHTAGWYYWFGAYDVTATVAY